MDLRSKPAQLSEKSFGTGFVEQRRLNPTDYIFEVMVGELVPELDCLGI